MSELFAWDDNGLLASVRGAKIQAAFSSVPDADRATTYPRFKASSLQCLLTRSPEHVTIFYRR